MFFAGVGGRNAHDDAMPFLVVDSQRKLRMEFNYAPVHPNREEIPAFPDTNELSAPIVPGKRIVAAHHKRERQTLIRIKRDRRCFNAVVRLIVAAGKNLFERRIGNTLRFADGFKLRL